MGKVDPIKVALATVIIGVFFAVVYLLSKLSSLGGLYNAVMGATTTTLILGGIGGGGVITIYFIFKNYGGGRY